MLPVTCVLAGYRTFARIDMDPTHPVSGIDGTFVSDAASPVERNVTPDSAAEGLCPDFPNAGTTGVPAGTTLTAYTGPMTITQDNVVIEGKIIDGSLRVTGDNVVFKNCKITYDGWWGIDAEGGANITVQNCDIIGPGYSGDSNAGILGSGNFIGNDISKSENGIVLLSGASTVRGNYIHDLQDGTGDPHYDGISVQGGQNGVLIEGNTVIGRDTSAVFIKNDFGPINDVTVNHNYLAGDPVYNIYVDGRANGGPITGVTITNNYLEKGYYGYYSIDNSSPLISGNIEGVAGPVPICARRRSALVPTHIERLAGQS
jgi:hypothetical protein